MMMKRALVVLTLSVGVSARASAFAPGAAVKNHAGATQSAIHKQTPFPTTE